MQLRLKPYTVGPGGGGVHLQKPSSSRPLRSPDVTFGTGRKRGEVTVPIRNVPLLYRDPRRWCLETTPTRVLTKVTLLSSRMRTPILRIYQSCAARRGCYPRARSLERHTSPDRGGVNWPMRPVHRHLCEPRLLSPVSAHSALIGDERRRAHAASDMLARRIDCRLSSGAARQNVTTRQISTVSATVAYRTFRSDCQPRPPCLAWKSSTRGFDLIALEWICQPRCDTALDIHPDTTERAVVEYQSAGPWS